MVTKDICTQDYNSASLDDTNSNIYGTTVNATIHICKAKSGKSLFQEKAKKSALKVDYYTEYNYYIEFYTIIELSTYHDV